MSQFDATEMDRFMDFPEKIQRMIAERCDFLTRFNLRCTSKKMMQVVDSSDFQLLSCAIDMPETSMGIYANFLEEGHFISTYSMDLELYHAKYLAHILQGREVGSLEFNCHGEKAEEFARIFRENLKAPMKATNFEGSGKVYFDIFHRYGMEQVIVMSGEPSTFNDENLDTLRYAEKVWFNCPTEATDEFVMSMTSTEIHIESNKLTVRSVYPLVYRFVSRAVIDSTFYIINYQEDFDDKFKVPPYFIQDPQSPGNYYLRIGDKECHLEVDESYVHFKCSKLEGAALRPRFLRPPSPEIDFIDFCVLSDFFSNSPPRIPQPRD